MDDYEINDDTLAIIPLDEYKSKIIEKTRTLGSFMRIISAVNLLSFDISSCIRVKSEAHKELPL